MFRQMPRWLPRSRKGRFACASLLVLAVAAVLGWKWAYVTWKLRGARQSLRDREISIAVAELEAIESLQPDRAELLFLLGRAYRRADRLDKASSYLKRAEDAGWPKDRIRIQRQLLSVQSGRFGSDEDELKRLIKTGVDDDLAEEIYEAQAKGFLKTYRLQEAAFCLKYWIEWKPDRIEPRLWLADVYARVDDLKAAAREYRGVLQLDPDRSDAHLRLADVLLQLQETESARDHYQECLTRDSENAAARIGVVKCERRLGTAKDPGRQLRRILELELTATQRVDVQVELAQFEFRDARRPQAALEVLQRAVKIAPYNQPVHASMAAVYRRLGRDKLADAHDAKARESNARLERLVDMTRRVLHSPNDAQLRYEVGRLYMEQGMQREGAGWMRTALICDPHHQAARLALKEYQSQMKQD